MNEFQSVNSGAGILKQDYEDKQTPAMTALRKRRAKMAEKLALEQEASEG